MTRILKCANKNLAKDGSIPSKYVRPVLDAMNQVVTNASEALAKGLGKRKREGNDKGHESDSSDEEESSDLAEMGINELSQEMLGEG